MNSTRRWFLGLFAKATAASVAAAVPVIRVTQTKEEAEPLKGVGVLRYPPIAHINSDGTRTTGYALAKEVAKEIRSGSILALPSCRDSWGQLLWDFEIVSGDPTQVRIERYDSDQVA